MAFRFFKWWIPYQHTDLSSSHEVETLSPVEIQQLETLTPSQIVDRPEEVMKLLSPVALTQSLRQALLQCWLRLPPSDRNVKAVIHLFREKCEDAIRKYETGGDDYLFSGKTKR